MTAMMLCTLAQGKNRTVTENDSLGNKQRVIELRDTMIDGKAVTDTLSVMTYENSPSSGTETIRITSTTAVLTISAGTLVMTPKRRLSPLRPSCSYSDSLW